LFFTGADKKKSREPGSKAKEWKADTNPTDILKEVRIKEMQYALTKSTHVSAEKT